MLEELRRPSAREPVSQDHSRGQGHPRRTYQANPRYLASYSEKLASKVEERKILDKEGQFAKQAGDDRKAR